MLGHVTQFLLLLADVDHTLHVVQTVGVIHRKSELPASPDGRRQGDPCANSFSPAMGMDRSGPTAVLKSVSKVDLTKASHGSVLDMALHALTLNGKESMYKFESLVEAFLTLPCTATLQMNVIDRETLLQARERPDDLAFRTLIVRVWGFSLDRVMYRRAHFSLGTHLYRHHAIGREQTDRDSGTGNHPHQAGNMPNDAGNDVDSFVTTGR